MNAMPQGVKAPGARPATAPAFGPRIRALRIARGISLRAMAGMLGVSPATLSHIETGKTSLSADRLDEILRLLGGGEEQQPIAVTSGDPGAAVPPGEAQPAGGSAGKTPSAGSEPDLTAWRSFAPLGWDPVLTAALEAFVAVGYHGATVRDIAGRAGLSVPGMYHYYRSKQDMLVELLERTMTDLLWRSAAAREEGRDPVERFARIIECLVLFHTYRREPAFVGASEMRSLAPPARERIAARRVEQQHMIDDEVDAGIRERRFLTPHPHDAARAVVTMCVATTQWYRPNGPLSPEELADRYVKFALQLMQVAPSAGRSRRSGS